MKTIQISCLLVIILFSGLNAFAQKKNYKTYRDSLSQLSCTVNDLPTVTETIERMENIDTTVFKKNLHLYYKDLGWAYFNLYIHTKDTSHIKEAINRYHHRIGEHKEYWNLAFCYFWIYDCAQGHIYLQKYKEHTPRKYWMSQEQIESITARCVNE